MSTSQSAAPVATESSPVAVVQLYDTILLHIGRAGDAARKGDFQTQFDEVMNAARIVDGLNNCLDMNEGGQVAAHLREMYDSVSRALLRSVGAPAAAETYDKLIAAVRDTRNAWAEICGVPPLAAD
jgi:flagellar secretion chaperone FliS